MSVHSLHLVEIRNPFKPTEADRSTLEFRPGSSVADLYPSAVTRELQIGLNGMIVPLEKRDVTFVADGDYLVICPVIAGGGGEGGGKMILRIVALIAISVMTAGAGAALAAGAYGAMGGTLVAANAGLVLGAMGGVLQTGIMMAGGLLVNAMIPPPEPKKQEGNSPTYGIDGAQNTSAEGVVVPITYGTFRTAGNIIANYVVNDGETQWLYMMINAGEGPIENITDIWINDQPIETFNLATTPYKDIDYQIRLGEKNQLPVDWFADTTTPRSINFRLTDNWYQISTLGEVDQLRFDFVAPAGLRETYGDGDIAAITVSLNIQYRVTGTLPWLDIKSLQEVTSYAEGVEWFQVTTFVEANAENGTFIESTGPYVPTGSETRTGNSFYDAQGTQVGTARQVANYGTAAFEMSGNQTTAMRRSLVTQSLVEAAYDVRVRRTNVESQLTAPSIADTVMFSTLNEIVLEDVGYVNTATLSLKMRLGDQLNGIPSVTFLHHGKKIKSWNKTTKVWDYNGSSNPAWVAFDILTNKRYGGGAAVARFDLDAWKDWADWCATPTRNGTTQALEFNGTFDTQSNVWDANQKVMRCGHASIVRVGTRYTVAIEKDEQPSMMFSVANMVEGSFEESWSSMTERSNEIEGTYSDKADGYKPRTIRVYDKAAVTAGYPQRSSSVDLMGVTSAQQAWDDLNIMLNLNRYIRRTIKFSATMESLGCTVGSVVNVQHDMPKWGTGGRVEAGCTLSTLQLDREVTLEFAKTYKALIHHSSLQRYAGTTGAVVNTTGETAVILVGYNGATLPARLQVAGKDVEVLGKFTSGTNHGVTVALIAGLSSGAAYSLWDTDVIETRNVVNPAVSGTPLVVTSVQLSTPMNAVPAQFTNFMFGETDKVAKPFRIKSISGSHEYSRDIVATEFNASVYLPSGAVPTPNYSSLTAKVDHAVISGVSEKIAKNGISYKSLVTVSFQSTQQTYQCSNVYVSRNGGDLQWVGKDIFSVTVEAVKGELLKFRVVAMDVVGKSASESSAPTFSYTALGKVIVPGAVQSLGYVFTDTAIEFTFNPAVEQDWLTSQASTTAAFAAGTVIFDAKATTFRWAFQVAGTRPVWFRSLVQHNIPSVPVMTNVIVLAPATPTITSAQVINGVAMVVWTNAKTSQPIRNYEIRLGADGGTFATATETGKASSAQTAMSIVIPTEGARVIYIRAIDVAGNYSPVASTTVVVSGGSTLRLLADSQVIRLASVGTLSPATVNLTAVFTGALMGAVASFTNNRGVTLGGTNNVRALTVADLGTNLSISITATYVVPGGTTYSDTVTVTVLEDGSQGIAVILSNESHTLSANSSGVVDSFAGADSYINAYGGGTDETAAWTFTKSDINIHSRFEYGKPNHIVVDGFSATKLLLHGDGVVGSNSIVDSSFSAHTVINPGTAVSLVATNAKFNQAINFSGAATSYLEVDWAPEFRLSDLEFAIQMQIFLPALTGARQFLIGWWGPGAATADHSWALLIDVNGKLNFDYSSAYDNADFTIVSTLSVPTGALTEIGVGRAGSVLTLKIGATLQSFAFTKTIRTIGSDYTGTTQLDNFLLPQVFNYL